MNAVERLEAAITKLEELRAGGAATWYVKPDDLIGGHCIMPVDATPATAPRGTYPIADFTHAENAELVVTLHRTIDAQLAAMRLLRDSWREWGITDVSPMTNPMNVQVVALADAILGGTS